MTGQDFHDRIGRIDDQVSDSLKTMTGYARASDITKLNGDITSLNTSVSNLQAADTALQAVDTDLTSRMVAQEKLTFDTVKARLMWDNRIVGGSYPRVKIQRLNWSSASSGPFVRVPFSGTDLEILEDTDGIRITLQEYLTVPAGLGGEWQVEAIGTFPTNGTGNRSLRLVTSNNETNTEMMPSKQHPASSVSISRLGFVKTLKLIPGATVELQSSQNSGATLICQMSLQMRMVKHTP